MAAARSARCFILGEINDAQQAAWRKTLAVFDEDQQDYRTLSLFPEDRAVPPDAIDSLQVRLSGLQLRRPRPFGNCWLASEVWRQLGLTEFWQQHLPAGRESVSWEKVLRLLVVNRLLEPGSEFRVHRHWFVESAMDALLETDFAVAEKDRLYRCLDRIVPHKQELFVWLRQKWAELFQADFEVLLYDLTSTYFEGDMEESEKARRGYSRDSRPDCAQVVIALIVTPDGFPLAYEVMDGNTSEQKTLKPFLDQIEKTYGQAKRVWVMDRGIPTEATLAQMRERNISYLVGTPKGRINKHEKKWLNLEWQQVRDSVQVKLYEHEQELYVLARSDGRQAKEIAIRRRKRLRRYIERLKALQSQLLTRDQLLMKLGAAKHDAGRAANLVHVSMPTQATKTASLEFRLDRHKLRQVRRREGRYLLRTNLTAHQPQALWTFYIQLTEVEQAFKEIKHDLAIQTDLPQDRTAHRGPHLRGLHGLLPASHAQGQAARLGRRHDAARSHRQVQDHADGGREAAHHRWARADPFAIYATRARTPHAA